MSLEHAAGVGTRPQHAAGVETRRPHFRSAGIVAFKA